MADDFKRGWPASALITLGDALADEGYFDQAPILEMVYHLRNGVAHGNEFAITNLTRLERHPANTRGAFLQGPKGQSFEITASLTGMTVLFDYMDPGDILDVLMSVGRHLRELADAG